MASDLEKALRAQAKVATANSPLAVRESYRPGDLEQALTIRRAHEPGPERPELKRKLERKAKVKRVKGFLDELGRMQGE